MKPSRRHVLRIGAAAAAAKLLENKASAASLTANIWVRADQIYRSIPPEIFGTTIEWNSLAGGLWRTDLDDVDPSILAHSQDLAVSLVRFPGGLLTDFYHWQSGVGPRNQREPVSPYPGGPPEVNYLGTDEALDFASRIGAKLLISVNVGTGTADEAAAWVQYVNGNSPGRVKYWEIGNELYDQGGFAQLYVTMQPQDYAAKVVDFASAMRQVDPTIKIGAIGLENYGNYQLNSFPDWNDYVLTVAGGVIDFLSVHNAYSPVNYFDQELDVRTVYTAMLAFPYSVRNNLASLATQINILAPAYSSKIALAVSEWGPLFQFQPSPYVLHVRTLGSALYIASIFKQLIDSPRVVTACTFDLISTGFIGWIATRQGSYIKNAQCFAMQMYTLHFGNLHVNSYYECPTFDTVAVGAVAAQIGVPYLDVITSLSADQSIMYMLVINKHFDQPIAAKISFVSGFNPKSSGTAWVLSGTGIDANTGTDGQGWGDQAQDSVNPQFNNGNPSAVGISSHPVSGIKDGFTYTFPPFSVTSLEIPRAS